MDVVLSEYLNKSHNFTNFTFYDVTLRYSINSLVLYTKLEKHSFVVEHGTSTVEHFIEQNGRGFLSLQGYSWLILPLLFEFLVGKKHENHLHSFAGKVKLKRNCMLGFCLWCISYLRLILLCCKISRSLNRSSCSPFNNLHIILIFVIAWLLIDNAANIPCVSGGYNIHSNPCPNSGTEKFCNVNNILYIIATALDVFRF